MHHSQAPSPTAANSVPEQLGGKTDSGVWRSFTTAYGTGIRYLLHRYGHDEDAAFKAVAEASIDAIAREQTPAEQIPGVIRATLHQVLAHLPKTKPQEAALKADSNELAQKLMIFSEAQREALYRFYVRGEDATLVCFLLQLSLEQFTFIRQLAIRAICPKHSSGFVPGRKRQDSAGSSRQLLTG